ncbi:MAG: hypothetical protein ABR879_04250 [Methanomassiliicoccales archaeon]|jgi:hypothetical protein
MSGVLLDTERVVLVVDPGVCRLTSKIEAWSEDGVVKCKIESRCLHVQEFAEKLEGMSMMDIVKMPFSENKVFQVGGTTLKHSTCVVPTAVLKAMEAAAGLGLKKDVCLKFQKQP